MEPEVKENKNGEERPYQKHHNDDECEHDHHRGHDRHGGGPRPDIPPHLMREILDMREKIGKLEGMLEVLMKKM